VRRPFLVTASQVIAGFDEVAWRDAVG
jgi:hypothetical protein